MPGRLSIQSTKTARFPMKVTVSDEHAGQRLDVFVAEHWDKAGSRSQVQRSIKTGNVRVDEQVVSRPSTRLNAGQAVHFATEPAPTVAVIVPTDIPLDVVFEDDHIAVIDKAVGLTVHPGAGHDDDTLVNAAVARWPQIVNVGEPDRPGIVHRLDRDTSGLMVIALAPTAYSKLSEMIRAREITRIYTALVHGHPKSQRGVVDAPIGRDPYHRTRQAILDTGRTSRTHYELVINIDDFAVLEIRLETGRMHQIRVHMQAIGHPVVGDQSYGKRIKAKNPIIGNLNYQFLHASKLEFKHPITGEQLSITSKLPATLQAVLDSLA